MNFYTMRRRSQLNRRIRDFFDSRGYLEVETPLLSPALIPEEPIEIFETSFSHDFLGDRQLYLIPSPEVFMKKLIAEGSGNIYQLTKSFRNNEQVGSQHNPEFSLLEWYRMDADYRESMTTTEELFAHLLDENSPATLHPPFLRYSIREIFLEKTGIDLLETVNLKTFSAAAKKAGLEPAGGTEARTWEELYHRIFLTHVEPELPTDRPVFLFDYPARIPCLAKDIPGTPWKERWELYVNGIETANCYTEETNPARVEAFFREETSRKAAAARVLPDTDTEFLKIFRRGFPECSGVALGLDRLFMALLGQNAIEGVIFFPFSDILHL
jgi:lysyl-tRNA synthetase class 2